MPETINTAQSLLHDIYAGIILQDGTQICQV